LEIYTPELGRIEQVGNQSDCWPQGPLLNPCAASLLSSRAPPLLRPAITAHQHRRRPPPPPPSHSYSLREIPGRARNPIKLVSAMPGDDDKTKDTSLEPTLAELAKIMRETCSAVKDLGARVQALEVAAQATTVATPEGVPYGLAAFHRLPRRLRRPPRRHRRRSPSRRSRFPTCRRSHHSSPTGLTHRCPAAGQAVPQGAPPTPTAPTSSPLSAARAAAHSRGWAFRASASWSSPPTTVPSIR
jgi:hypothetical protein